MYSLDGIIQSYIKMLNESSSPENLEEKLITFGGHAYPRFGHIIILAGGAGCFDSETLVKTTEGYKRIKNVEKGDSVYTLNEETKNIEIKEVECRFEFDEHPENILELKFDNGETVICTENHEFYVDGVWVKAKDL
jgi:phage gp45-like